MKYLKTFENKEPEMITTYRDYRDAKIVAYKLNGEYHREDGPALIWYHKKNKKGENYYLNGIFYNRENWLEKLKEFNSPHYKKQQDLYNMEKNIEKYNI